MCGFRHDHDEANDAEVAPLTPEQQEQLARQEAQDARTAGILGFVVSAFFLAPGTIVAVKDMTGETVGSRMAFAVGTAVAVPFLCVAMILAGQTASWLFGAVLGASARGLGWATRALLRRT